MAKIYYVIVIIILACQITSSYAVHSPNYVQIDFYKKLVNGTFGQMIPLDFIVYPLSVNTLPLTAGANYGFVTMQLPLFWRNSGQTVDGFNPGGNAVTCNYGIEPASACTYILYLYEIKTPVTTSYEKFPPQKGLG